MADPTSVNYSMNIGSQGIEMDRTIENLGYMSMDGPQEQPDISNITPAETRYKSVGNRPDSNPGKVPAPLENAVQPSANTQMTPFDPSAHDLVVRSNK